MDMINYHFGILLDKLHILTAADKCSSTCFCHNDLIPADITPVLFTGFFYTHWFDLL